MPEGLVKKRLYVGKSAQFSFDSKGAFMRENQNIFLIKEIYNRK
jgi:hypothetical protein